MRYFSKDAAAQVNDSTEIVQIDALPAVVYLVQRFIKCSNVKNVHLLDY